MAVVVAVSLCCSFLLFVLANNITHVFLHSNVYLFGCTLDRRTASSAWSAFSTPSSCVLLFRECFYSCFAILSLFVAVSQLFRRGHRVQYGCLVISRVATYLRHLIARQLIFRRILCGI